MKVLFTGAGMALIIAMTVLVSTPAKAEACRWEEDTQLYAAAKTSKSAAIAEVDAQATAEAEDTCILGVCNGATLTITDEERSPVGNLWLVRGYKTFRCILF